MEGRDRPPPPRSRCNPALGQSSIRCLRLLLRCRSTARARAAPNGRGSCRACRPPTSGVLAGDSHRCTPGAVVERKADHDLGSARRGLSRRRAWVAPRRLLQEGVAPSPRTEPELVACALVLEVPLAEIAGWARQCCCATPAPAWRRALIPLHSSTWTAGVFAMSPSTGAGSGPSPGQLRPRSPSSSGAFPPDALVPDRVIEPEFMAPLPHGAEGLAIDGSSAIVLMDGDEAENGATSCRKDATYTILRVPPAQTLSSDTLIVTLRRSAQIIGVGVRSALISRTVPFEKRKNQRDQSKPRFCPAPQRIRCANRGSQACLTCAHGFA